MKDNYLLGIGAVLVGQSATFTLYAFRGDLAHPIVSAILAGIVGFICLFKWVDDAL